jgi:mono/diheme cytochrome c family protein
MNYPIWEVPAAGLLIAAIAILHVFISHFAVGGGLFLVLLEGKAYRERDEDLLNFVKGHTRFFVLLTLVLGAVTGVGIWFTISLVHPQANSTLIQIFVWVWAIEWVFFLTEITAAMVYYYGWNRLNPRTHLAVGWIYFGSAWLSLAAINGILTFMLTPGEWVTSGNLWDGFFNPTYWPSLVARTLVAVGLAGLYALFTVSFLKPVRLKQQIIRYASTRWLLPSVACLPAALLWYLMEAKAAGIPAFKVLGSEAGTLLSLLAQLLGRTSSVGIPLAQQGVLVTFVSSALLLILTLAVLQQNAIRPGVAGFLLFLGLAAFGGAEWVREDLRKPYVLGRHMFVNGVRLPVQGFKNAPVSEDPFQVGALNRRGVLATALWSSPAQRPHLPEPTASSHFADGRELFKLLCSSCHTLSGHMGIKQLTQGQTTVSLESLLGKLAEPVNRLGQTTDWGNPRLRLRTWKGRRMPPFVGTEEEKRALAQFLASLHREPQRTEHLGEGGKIFEKKCLFCHGPGSNWPMQRIAAGTTAVEFYSKIARLPEMNPIMPPFEGTDSERRTLAEYLEYLVGSKESVGGGP